MVFKAAIQREHPGPRRSVQDHFQAGVLGAAKNWFLF